MTDSIIPLLRADGVSKIYSQGALAVGLHRFSASFHKGEFVAITGSSGSGKSTLLNVLSGLDSYDEGELYFLEEPTSHYTEEDRSAYRMDHVAFIFQDYNIMDSYTVYQNIELALLYSIPDRDKRKARVMELIEAVGLTGHEKQRCSKLSGGQKQRVSIARALAKDAPILFADEPCGNLDSTMTGEIMDLLHAVSTDKLVIIVTHSYDEVAPYATRKIRLADGELVEDQIIQDVAQTEEELPPRSITKRQTAEALILVASNNLKATPKRTVFGLVGLCIMTTLFIVGLMLVVNLMGLEYFNTTGAGTVYVNDLQVCKRELSKTNVADKASAVFADEEIGRIAAMDGVLGVYRDNGMLNKQVYFQGREYREYRLARPMSNAGVLYQGRMPEADDEMVISMPASRKELKNVTLGSTVDLHTIDEDYYMYGEEGQGKPYKLVGIVIDDQEVAYFTDAFFRDTSEASADTHINAIAFYVPDNWSTVYAYVYKDTNEKSPWPGEMVYATHGVVNYSIPSEYTHVVFNNGVFTDEQFPEVLSAADADAQGAEKTVAIAIADGMAYTTGAKDAEGNYTVQSYPTVKDCDSILIVNCKDEVSLARVRATLVDRGYVVYHAYGDNSRQGMDALLNIAIAAGMLIGMMLIFRIITGSYRALEASKRSDYNIMRTVGLPNPFVKSIYYVEMGLQGAIGWLAGVVGSVIIGLVYGFVVTPSAAYGFKYIAAHAASLAWIVPLALVVDMVVTISNAVRFNRYFYRKTVKMSLKEAANND